ncbi:MAG: DUF3313 family protein [Candidatus Omnitrophica bacterium]|nr:DUF3313 family protein [Candidatus Omnitrophota bacterium]
MKPLLAAIVLAIGLAGCKAAPGRNAGFVDEARMTAPADLPFQKAWIDPAVDWQRYRRIQIASVNTDHLSEMEWAKQVDRREKLREDAGKLAGYAQEIFVRTFREDSNHRFEVVDQPDAETLVFELALVEIIPSKLGLNTLCYAPFVGTAARLFRGMKHRSTVAFEARMRDGGTGAVIAQFADREAEKTTLISVKDATWYGHAESIIAEWAQQFVRLASRKPGEVVRDSKPFHLKPW